MKPRDVLDALGGYREVANDLGLEPTVVWKWQKFGLPAKRWPTIVALAKRKGRPDITLDRIAAAGTPASRPVETRGGEQIGGAA